MPTVNRQPSTAVGSQSAIPQTYKSYKSYKPHITMLTGINFNTREQEDKRVMEGSSCGVVVGSFFGFYDSGATIEEFFFTFLFFVRH